MTQEYCHWSLQIWLGTDNVIAVEACSFNFVNVLNNQLGNEAVHKAVIIVDTVACACNSSFLGGGDWEALGLEASLGKKLARLHLNQ
jgi:hypothetical protein